MLQDPNVERYVADAIKPLKKQIKELKAEIEALKQVKNLNIPVVSGMCEHPWASVIGDGEMKPAKCLKCGKYL